jgi:putative peptide zinc metalloprotease protein
LFVFFVPLPYRVMCSFEIKPRNAESVYVDVPGTLEQINVTAGERVTANKPLAILANPDVRIAAEELKGKKAQLEAQYEALWRQRYTTPQAGDQLAKVKESLDSIEKELSDKELDLGRLTLLSPIAGVVMPPPAMPARTEDDSRLPNWTGTPLERKNLGASLKESSLFCQVGDPTQWEAILVVDQADVDLIHEHQRVDIKLDQLPAETLEGQISEISKSDLKVAPRQLSSTVGGDLVTRTDANGVQRPVGISYQALVPLDDPREFMLTGLRGRAKIHADYQTLWQRGSRYFSQTFNFKL